MLPTPAIAHLAAADGVAAAVITASHNPFADNGVKLFAAGGRKLSDDVEQRIEAELGSPRPARRASEPTSARSTTAADGGSSLRRAPHRTVRPGALAGVSLVLDCANGAMSRCRAAGRSERWVATPSCWPRRPTVRNINAECGATAPAALAAAVVADGAALGSRLRRRRRPADRRRPHRRVVDGDQLIALLAADLRAHGRLAHDTVVVTVMSNLGFHRAMDAAGINVVTTAVGDRYVLEALGRGGFSLGGEQSGHLILSELATTGDGLLAGLLLVDLVRRRRPSLAELAARR